ncbi:class I SAM-dependent methyltransferase [Allohahella marinimesophila]
MAWDREDFSRAYRRLAPVYDHGLLLYELVGMRLRRYRREAVAGLHLQPGDTVVDLGCGTGVNLPLLLGAVGPTGRIIGVDLSPEMLEQAQRKIDAEDWCNVELVASDMVDYVFPPHVDAVLATLALATIPDYDSVIRTIASALPPGGRLANFEMTWPEAWPDWLVKLGAKLQQPFGVTTDLKDRKPARSIQRHFARCDSSERYFGAISFCIAIRQAGTGVNV